ncbi:MAG: NAD-dependent epimerase/dehydratase family protein [Pseudomonadota bacterium]
MKNLRIGITGINGLLGWHLRAYLHGHKDIDVFGADRATLSDPMLLDKFVSGVDAIAHFAGMNRGSDEVLEATNIGLAEALIAACQRTGATPQVVHSSSTHVDRDTAYGRSKRISAELFREWAKKTGAQFSNVTLPHVFGEFGKPFYNSAVSTFCHQLANKEKPQVVKDSALELVHTQDVAQLFLSTVKNNIPGEQRVKGIPTTVNALLDKLGNMAATYAEQRIPDVRNALDLRLFNTYRSYLFPAKYPVSLQVHTDVRGGLYEAVKSENGGQMFFSTTKPGIARGNHYHTRKIERFLVTNGEATIRLRKLFSQEIFSFAVTGTAPCYIDMPTFYTHNITNTGNDILTTAFWAHEIFDRQDPDTFSEQVDPV